jgi:hypothetical protein
LSSVYKSDSKTWCSYQLDTNSGECRPVAGGALPTYQVKNNTIQVSAGSSSFDIQSMTCAGVVMHIFDLLHIVHHLRFTLATNRRAIRHHCSVLCAESSGDVDQRDQCATDARHALRSVAGARPGSPLLQLQFRLEKRRLLRVWQVDGLEQVLGNCVLRSFVWFEWRQLLQM